MVSKAFITKHQRSWNEHIPRISPYLILGEGIWWKSYEEEYQFFDGESHELPPMPHLLHFRSATLEDVYKRQSSCWETILEEKVDLPTPDLYEEVSLAPTQLQNTHTTQPHSSTQITSLPSQPPTTLTEIHKQASHTTAQNKEGYHTDIEATSTAEMELNIGDQEHIETAQPILTQAQTFKTKHAACLAKLLGPTTKVIEFDTLRATVKSSKRPSKGDIELHDKLLTAIQNAKTIAIEQIKQVEANYFSSNHALPTEKTSSELAKLLKVHKLATRMLATWHINF